VALATYKDLCIDAVDAGRLGRFWAEVLRLELTQLDDGDVRLTGRTPRDTVWVNSVPEPVTVKHRVHLDVRAESPAALERLGAAVVDAHSFPWTVMRDPEGGELCVFGLRPGTEPGPYELVVDCADPGAISGWWAVVLGARRQDDEEKGFSWIEEVPHCPWEGIVFVPVPEPKTVKNRIHLDVSTGDLEALLAAGATVLRRPDGEIGWHVLADPEGNEFCAFAAAGGP
jgi:hypothetical protein